MAFAFVPPTGLNDVTNFPTKDTLIRKHIQDLLQQIPDYFESDLFDTASLNSNGWFKHKKTGFIIQWGRGVTGMSNGIADAQIFFQFAYPNACFGVFVNGEETSNAGTTGSSNVTRQLNANAEVITKNVFTIRGRNIIDTNGAQATYKWFSIGN